MIGARSGGANASGYRERLSAPIWWYPVAVVIAVILASEFHVADNGLTVVVPTVISVVFGLAIVWSTGRASVVVDGGELRVRDAHLPLDAIAGVVPLDGGALRMVVGRHGDPAAFCRVRPWVAGGVQLLLDDPEDPTPYWVVSTRHPQRLADAVRAGQRAH